MIRFITLIKVFLLLFCRFYEAVCETTKQEQTVARTIKLTILVNAFEPLEKLIIPFVFMREKEEIKERAFEASTSLCATRCAFRTEQISTRVA